MRVGGEYGHQDVVLVACLHAACMPACPSPPTKYPCDGGIPWECPLACMHRLQFRAAVASPPARATQPTALLAAWCPACHAVPPHVPRASAATQQAASHVTTGCSREPSLAVAVSFNHRASLFMFNTMCDGGLI